MANPNPKEQYMLELINRMRTNPETEYDFLVNSTNEDIKRALDYFKVDLTELKSQWNQLKPAQPVAWSNLLHDSAVTHTQLMINNDQQSHNFPEEPSLTNRITKTGYQPLTVGENIYAFGHSVFHSHAAFAIDWGTGANGIQNPPGHRNAIMSNNYREVGVGILENDSSSTKVGALLTTQHFANSKTLSTTDTSWLLGSVFRDLDKDDFYSIGEGLGDITVQIQGISDPNFNTSIQTLDAGGYQTLLSSGEYQIQFIRDKKTLKTEKVTVGKENIKLDLMIEGTTYQSENGKQDAFNTQYSGDVIVFNAYTLDSELETEIIDFISVGLSEKGNPSKVFLYQDKDNDKQPDSNEKILEVDTKLLDKEGFGHIPIEATTVNSTFFVGALYENSASKTTWIPVADSSSGNQSWVATSETGNLDLDNFSPSEFKDKNFLLRASSSESTKSVLSPNIPSEITPNPSRNQTIGTNLQKSHNIELIDLTDETGTLKVSVEVTRDADYDNLIGFYQVNDVNGGIQIKDEIINPGDSRYKQLALENRITSLDLLRTNNRSQFEGVLDGSNIFAPFIIVNGNLDDALNSNAEVYFAFQGANTDKFDHIRLIGENQFGFEDLHNGGDKDFNDLIIDMKFTT